MRRRIVIAGVVVAGLIGGAGGTVAALAGGPAATQAGHAAHSSTSSPAGVVTASTTTHAHPGAVDHHVDAGSDAGPGDRRHQYDHDAGPGTGPGHRCSRRFALRRHRVAHARDGRPGGQHHDAGPGHRRSRRFSLRSERYADAVAARRRRQAPSDGYLRVGGDDGGAAPHW